MSDDYEPKPFKCKGCGWILGESYREQGKRITQLRVYRYPSGPDWKLLNPQLITSAPVLAVLFVAVQVNDCAVLCENCGEATTWYANQTAIDDILSRRRKQKEKTYEPIA